MRIKKRKQESKGRRKKKWYFWVVPTTKWPFFLTPPLRKNEIKHALDQENDQEKKILFLFFLCRFLGLCFFLLFFLFFDRYHFFLFFLLAFLVESVFSFFFLTFLFSFINSHLFSTKTCQCCCSKSSVHR